MIFFTNEAKLDLSEIIFYYDSIRQGLSYDFELCLEAGIEQIIQNPEAFQRRYKNVKIRFIARFPYGIHYSIYPEKIIIVGIFHTSRSPKNWENRL